MRRQKRTSDPWVDSDGTRMVLHNGQQRNVLVVGAKTDFLAQAAEFCWLENTSPNAVPAEAKTAALQAGTNSVSGRDSSVST